MRKATEITQLVRKFNLDILSVNETNLNDTVDSSTLGIPTGYSLLRRDRGIGSRGGCAMIVSKNCAHKQVEIKTNVPDIEAIWLKVKSSNIHICGFYRSNNFCKVDKFIDYIVECMAKLRGKRVIWIGDINLDQCKINSPNYKRLDATLKSFGMVQIIQDPTRIAKLGDRYTSTIIDVIFTNCRSDILYSKVLPEKIGDHQAIMCDVEFKVLKPPKFEKVTIKDYCTANIDAFHQYLVHTDFTPLLLSNDVDAVAAGLDYHLNEHYDEFFPLKTIKKHPNFIFKPSVESLQAIKKKKKMHGKFRKLLKKVERSRCNRCKSCQLCKKSDEAWKLYKEARNACNITTKLNKKANIVKDLRAKSAIHDLKGVWKTIKNAANLAPKTNKQNGANGSDLDGSKLNDHFCKVGPNLQAKIPIVPGLSFSDYLAEVPTPSTKFETFESIVEAEVKAYIKSLPTNKSIADNIPLRIFKVLINPIIAPITHIINLSLATGRLPDIYKYAKVCAIHKSGPIDDPNNYRPISILPLIGKCIEYIVNRQLSDYMESNNLLTKHQFGFRKNHSTTYLMYDLFDNIFDNKAKSCTPSIVFLDIRKAFDTVDHKILIEKLKFYGVDGIVILWIQSYLENRYQSTKFGGIESLFELILCGVPQGSILGPLLFSIYINDMSYICHLSTPYLFADDGALCFEDTCRKTFLAIKLELRTIMNWLHANKLSLNTDKTNFVVFDNSAELSSIDIGHNEIIREVKSTKYLGLILDNRLKFDLHIDYIKKKVLKRIGAMYKASNLLPPKYKKMFANSLMLPQFDYLDTIYNRASKTKLAELDILYKKVAKIALGVSKNESSITVYKDMGWLPLHLRRQLHLASYMFRIIEGNCPESIGNKFSYITGGSRDGDNCNLYTPRSRSLKHFYYLGVKAWNIVPQPLRGLSDPKEFSKLYKTSMLKSIQTDIDYVANNSFEHFYKIIVAVNTRQDNPHPELRSITARVASYASTV